MIKNLIANQVPRRFLIKFFTRQCSSFIDDQYFSTLKEDCHSEIKNHEPEVVTLIKNSSEARTIDLTEKLDDFSYIDQQYFKGNIANSLLTILFLKDWFLFCRWQITQQTNRSQSVHWGRQQWWLELHWSAILWWRCWEIL